MARRSRGRPVSTPGVNETRSSESCRIVRVSPTPPRMTSWCATRPRIRRPWTRTPSTSAPRAPSRPVEVASGIGALPASRRAAAISSAVRRAVPDGASALSGWCSSTTSTDSKNGAAWAAKRIIRIAPMREVGGDQDADARARRRARSSSWSSRASVEAGGADDRVDAVLDAELEVVHHDVGVGEVDDRPARPAGPARRCRRRRRPTPPARASGAASTARQTSAPTLPRAPSTPTRI